ncbi:cutinase family protein [Nocardia sp. XZ_19_385]|uniref:cutinase family protein n=1 Tax=Nocardia sp. XZ_19_385 TaxID=2769488 RepID=UPI001E5C9BFD|nr:cutinase family protein [Nocardia sp. XZ_19_385]
MRELPRRPSYRVRGGAVAMASIVTVGAGAAVASAADPFADLTAQGCPAVYALGVQGTGQSAPDAPVTTDTGMLSQVFVPLQADADAAGVKISRAYVPYDASFGGLDRPANPDTASYERSVSGGLKSLDKMASQIVAACPATRIAVAGYSQGAHVVSMWAKQVGTGSGAVAPSQVAAVALFGDPVRAPGSPTFPGRAGQDSPDPAPETSGAAVGELSEVPQAPTSGGGIGPERDKAGGFGALDGRVMSVCASGDLACDAPSHAPILEAVANIAGQADSGGDPLRALWSVTQALAFTTIKTATSAVNEDVKGDSLANLSINPKVSLSQRIADASDPRTALAPGDVVQAVLKVATIGFNSVAAVAETLLTPDTIASVATAGLANPVAGLAVFGVKLLGALPQLMPPRTAIGLVKSAFEVVTTNISDNRDLVDTAVWTKYSDAITKHNSYGQNPISADGQSATRYVADWFAAIARDSAGSAAPSTAGKAQPSPQSRTGTTTATPRASVPPTSTSRPSDSAQYPWDPSGGSGLEDLPIPGAESTATSTTAPPSPPASATRTR